jgi:hypothetical protein
MGSETWEWFSDPLPDISTGGCIDNLNFDMGFLLVIEADAG